MVFRALIVLFSSGYNIEIYKIIEATFVTLHFCHMRVLSQVKVGAWFKWSNGKYASASWRQKTLDFRFSGSLMDGMCHQRFKVAHK